RFRGRQASVPVVRFGNVQEKDLAEIINDQAYRAFRQQFFRRETEAVARALMAATGEAGYEANLPPPPSPCLTCYKLYGV
ncbi:MAG TPA: SPASM domain-containing protein, partial [Candidatus Acidoferrum sp.]|nr:SPASM domain-containing protein [Candidatus Acidoferrum sp.]